MLTIRTKMNKKHRAENKIYMVLRVFFILKQALKPPTLFRSGILSRSLPSAAGTVKWITSRCEKQCG